MEEKEEKNILKEIVQKISNKPDIIIIEVKPANRIQKILLRYGWIKPERHIVLGGLRVVNAYRIAGAILDIPAALVDIGSPEETKGMYEALLNHLDKIIEVVAIAVHNGVDEPSNSLKRQIRLEWSDEELLAVLLMVMRRFNIQAFLNSIILTRGLDILSQEKVSPKDTGEIIAPGE